MQLMNSSRVRSHRNSSGIRRIVSMKKFSSANDGAAAVRLSGGGVLDFQLEQQLIQVRDNFKNAVVNSNVQLLRSKDPGCGFDGGKFAGQNTCMDDYTVAAAGFAWIAGVTRSRSCECGAERDTIRASSPEEEIGSCFHACQAFRLELRICLSQDITQTEGAIELVECGSTKRAVGGSSQRNPIAGAEQERCPRTEGVVALVRESVKAALNRGHQRRGAGVCLIIVPIIVATAESEQQVRVQANGILHKGPETFLTSARVDQRCYQ
jgi:hypothetical protein